MSVQTRLLDAPKEVLEQAGEFLSSAPVRHNLILTLLQERLAHSVPGRYWVVRDVAIVGVALQSPLHLPVNLTPMEPAVAAALADSIGSGDVAVPGVTGEAACAAHFAGQWTECRNSSATPIQAQRLYEVRDLLEWDQSPGCLRQATRKDRDLVLAWMRAFQVETSGGDTDPREAVDHRLPAGQFWLWEDGEPVSLVGRSLAVEGVVRVQAAYTPREHRNRGYGAACVRQLSKQILAGGHRCILYTDLANAVSNAVFRRVGYCAVAEALRYRFD